MTAIVPAKRPQISLSEVAQVAERYGKGQAILLGYRGYYKTMGDPAKNDRGIYDDAIALYCPSRCVAFNANVDPQGFRKGIAVLQPGVYSYKIGIHGITKPPEKRYEALVQAAPVTILRDGASATETGFFGLNIHRGSYGSVSSVGCQTLYPSQWDEFIFTVKAQMKALSQDRISYVLREE